jgi:hypothetical protein
LSICCSIIASCAAWCPSTSRWATSDLSTRAK